VFDTNGKDLDVLSAIRSFNGKALEFRRKAQYSLVS
jgi:hypothetical protein